MERALRLVMATAGLAMVGESSGHEQVRLRAHFDSVLVELRSRDVSTLSANQLTARIQLIGWLDDYREARRFPLNDRYSAHPTPIFRDARNRTCAMAYLIERSGRRDVVDRIARTQNLAFIQDLVGDSSLAAWLDSVGLSAKEAARIQPSYGSDGPGGFSPLAAAGVTVVLSGASVATTVSNIVRPSEANGFLGIAVGALTLGAASVMSHDHVGLTAINAVSGGAAVLSGLYAAFRPRSKPRDGNRHVKRLPIEWTSVTDWTQDARRTRVGISIRF